MARRKQKSPGFRYVGKTVETSPIRFDNDVFIEKAKASAAGGLTTLAFDSSGKVIKELQPRRINNLPDTNAAFVVSDFFQSGINLNLAEGTTGGVTANRTHQMPTATEFANNALSDILTSFEFIIVNLDDEFNVEPTTNTGLTLIGSMRVSPGTSATFTCIRTSSKSATNAVTIVRAASDAFSPADGGDITSVVAGTNLTGGATSGAATINLADASTSAKGAASFSSDNFAASSGAITIKDGGVDLAAEVTGVLPSANMDGDTAHLTTNQTFTGTKTFDETISGSVDGNAATVTTNANLTGHVTSSGNAAVLGSFTVSQLSTAISNATISGSNTGDETKSDIDALAITTVGTLDTGNATAIVSAASATAAGKVELATTAEANSGTDTARAITAAGLKSHVDARFSYQNISFTGQSTVPSDGDWMTVSGNGISNHTWNTNLGSGGTSVGSTTVTIPTGQICQGIIVPYDCVLVGFASLIRSVGNHQSKVGLAVGVPTYNDFATFDCTLRAYNAADVSAGPDSNYSQRPVRADFLTANYAMSAGHVIFPLIGSVASNSRTVQWNCTLVLKTLIP